MVSFCPKREETVHTPPTIGDLLTNRRCHAVDPWGLKSGCCGDLRQPCSKLRLRVEREAGEALGKCSPPLPRAFSQGLARCHTFSELLLQPLSALRCCHCILSLQREEGEAALLALPTKQSSPGKDLAQAETTEGLTRPKKEHLVPLQAAHLTSPTAGSPLRRIRTGAFPGSVHQDLGSL